MPTFAYTVRDRKGVLHEGTVPAADEKAARSTLRQRGYFVTALSAVRTAASFEFLVRVGEADLLVFTQQFSDMVGAGLPLVSCLMALEEQTTNRTLKKVVRGIRSEVEGGTSLSAALAKYPRIFPTLYGNLVAVGEASGMLPEVLKRIVSYLEKRQELRSRVRGAFFYPAIVLTVAVIVIAVLLIYVVPVFAEVYDRMKVMLPLPTRILLMMSSLVITRWYALVVLIGVGIFAINQSIKTREGKLFFDHLFMRLMIVGSLIRDVTVARFVRTLGTLLVSGVPILQSLEIVEKTVDNTVISAILSDLRSSVARGEGLSLTLKKHTLIPASVVQMVGAGEASGNLGEMLERTAEFLERQVDITTKRLTTILDPLLTVGLGVVIGFIAISIYLPLFDLMTVIAK